MEYNVVFALFDLLRRGKTPEKALRGRPISIFKKGNAPVFARITLYSKIPKL